MDTLLVLCMMGLSLFALAEPPTDMAESRQPDSMTSNLWGDVAPKKLEDLPLWASQPAAIAERDEDLAA